MRSQRVLVALTLVAVYGSLVLAAVLTVVRR